MQFQEHEERVTQLWGYEQKLEEKKRKEKKSEKIRSF